MNRELLVEIRNAAASGVFRDKTPYRSLSVATAAALAQKYSISGRHIELEALQEGIIPERYIRNMQTLSLQDQSVLLQSKVSVIGLGGLGGGVTEILSRIGVGRLSLVDGDAFEDSNLNRQFLSTHRNLAAAKADAAFQRVEAVNASVEVSVHREFLNAENAAGLLAGSDAVADCLDSLKFRIILEKACKSVGIPLVSAAVSGMSGQITTIFPEDPGLKLIYGDNERPPARGAWAAMGALPSSVALISALEASEVIKVLLKKGNLLRNRLMVVDLMSNAVEVLKLGSVAVSQAPMGLTAASPTSGQHRQCIQSDGARVLA